MVHALKVHVGDAYFFEHVIRIHLGVLSVEGNSGVELMYIILHKDAVVNCGDRRWGWWIYFRK